MFRKFFFVGAIFLVASFFTVGLLNNAQAAVTGTSTALVSATSTVKAGSMIPVLRLELSITAGETLSSTTVLISTSTSATSTAVASSSFDWVGVYKDANSDFQFDPADVLLATSSVNIATTTRINIAAATTTPATGTFFVVLRTSNAWTDNGYPEATTSVRQGVTVNIAAGTSSVVTSANSPTIGATTTAQVVADTHSQIPDSTKATLTYSSGNYYLADTGSGGLGEQGLLSVYTTSTSSAPIATGGVSASGTANFSIGSTFYSSLWLAMSDAAGNATSSFVQFIPNSTSTPPTVTSVNAFTNKIVINASKNLRGDLATNCANYTLNGSALSCGGYGSSFIEFMGNSVTIKNLSLTGGAIISLAISGVTDTNNLPLSYSNSSITVSTALLPTISSVSPTSGAVGDTVTIAGTNFGTDTGTVMFSGGFDPSTGPLQPIPASTTAWGATSITATVPVGAQGGPITIVTSDGMMSDMNQNTFFDISGPLNVRVDLLAGVSTSTVTSSGNVSLVIAGMSGPQVYTAASSGITFSTSTGVYTIDNIAGMGMVWAYDPTGARLPAPGANIQSGTSSSSPLVLTLQGATTRKVSGTITTKASCDADGRNKTIAVFAMPQGTNTQMGPGGVMPSFFSTTSTCQVAYAVALPSNGFYRVEAHLPPSQSTTSTSPLIEPSGQMFEITDSTTTITSNLTFTAADRKIYGRIVDGAGSALSASKYNEMWVTAYQPIANGKGSATMPNSTGYFSLYASQGTYKIGVGGPGMPGSVEKEIVVVSSSAFALDASTPVITIKLEPPTSSISGYVKDGSGNAIANVDLNAWCSGGPGGGSAFTDSQGYYKMYVSPCSNYRVGGFSKEYGQLSEQTNVVVTNSTSPTVNFTLSSANFITISGTVSKNGSGVSQVDTWVTQGEFGPGMGWAKTDSAGAFTFKTTTGLTNLYLHAAVMGQGEIYKGQLNSGNAVTASTTVTVAVNTATLEIRLKPKNTFSNVFIGAHSTLGGGFTNTTSSVGSDYDAYSIQIPFSGSTTYTIEGGIPGFGPITPTTTAITASTSIIIDLSATDFYVVSGTVSGSSTDAFVWAASPAGGGGSRVANDGTFSMKLRGGNYDIGVGKPGFLGTRLANQSISTTTAGLSLSLTQNSQSITGYVKYNGTAIEGARVWAEQTGSTGWAGAMSEGDGSFTLNVGSGLWKVQAIADGYNTANPISVTAPSAGLTVNLQAVSFDAKQTSQSFTPTQGGVVQTDDVKLNIPQGALGSDTTQTQVTVQNTMDVPDKNNVKVFGTKGKKIEASYSSGANQGQQITNLSQNVDMEIVLTKAELVSAGITSLVDANKIVIGYWDTTADNWTEISTTPVVAPTGATWDTLTSLTLKGTTSHFSTFAPIISTTSTAPATPTSLSATAGNGQVALSWTASTGATKYDVYRLSGSDYPYLGQTTVTSYTDTGLTNGTAYSYKVSALDSNDNESAATTDAVSATPAAPAAVAGSGLPISILSSGGGGGFTPSITATSSATSVTSTISQLTGVAQTSLPTGLIKKLTLRLMQGITDNEVKSLQEFLAKDSDVYPEGIISGYFGTATRRAVQRFQEKYGIAKSGNLGYGDVGPATRAKINQLLAGSSANVPQLPEQASSKAQLIQQLRTLIQEIEAKITKLLAQLQELKKATQ
ncbi:MAG: carboxypeptidase regulatory-like domain-containing protein [Candidatus Wolfebacteria bacterium]|nr:carboxypeptidase regulatory-like domain-containing protein [Candidatus Wolfebacteria bacterium]